MFFISTPVSTQDAIAKSIAIEFFSWISSSAQYSWWDLSARADNLMLKTLVAPNPAHRRHQGHYTCSIAIKVMKIMNQLKQTMNEVDLSSKSVPSTPEALATDFCQYLNGNTVSVPAAYFVCDGLEEVSIVEKCLGSMKLIPSAHGFISIFVEGRILQVYENLAVPKLNQSRMKGANNSIKLIAKVPNEIGKMLYEYKDVKQLEYWTGWQFIKTNEVKSCTPWINQVMPFLVGDQFHGYPLENVSIVEKPSSVTRERENERKCSTSASCMPISYSFMPIGHFSSVYQEKFGAPRQSGLVKTARGSLTLDKKIYSSSLEGLEEFSHAWIIFVFHQNSSVLEAVEHSIQEGDRAPTVSSQAAKVKPPKLQGSKVGSFATRSPHRFNPIGLTVARIERIDLKGRCVYFSGVDLLNGTPVLDIKPYHPADSLPLPSSLVMSHDFGDKEAKLNTKENQPTELIEHEVIDLTAREPPYSRKEEAEKARFPDWVVSNFIGSLQSTGKCGFSELNSSESDQAVIIDVQFNQSSLDSLDAILKLDFANWEFHRKMGHCGSSVLREFAFIQFAQELDDFDEKSIISSEDERRFEGIIMKARQKQRSDLLDCIRDTLAVDPRSVHSKSKFARPSSPEIGSNKAQVDSILETLAFKVDGLCVTFQVCQPEKDSLADMVGATQIQQSDFNNDELSIPIENPALKYSNRKPQLTYRVVLIDIENPSERLRSKEWHERTLERLGQLHKM